MTPLAQACFACAVYYVASRHNTLFFFTPANAGVFRLCPLLCGVSPQYILFNHKYNINITPKKKSRPFSRAGLLKSKIIL